MSESGSTDHSVHRSWFSRLLQAADEGASNWMWLSGIVIALDQITKALVARSLEIYQTVELLPILNLTHLHNTGAAFSMLAGATGWQRWFFTVLGLGVSAMLIIWLRRIHRNEQTLLALGLSLILGGALGNVIDRIWLGYVIDFIHVHWDSVGFSFAAFNVADSAISIGAACLLLDSFFEGRKSVAVENKDK